MRSTQPQRLTIIAVLIIIALFGLWLMTGTADAATDPQFTGGCFDDFTVTNTNDSGQGSLRLAVDVLCLNGTISFAPALDGQMVTLASQIAIFKPLTITGGPLDITISGDNTSRLFEVEAGESLTLDQLTLRDGSADFGGAIRNFGTLTLTHSTVVSNTASGDGGAVFSEGPLTIEQSTVANNTARAGGGIYSNAGVLLRIHDSQVEGNSSQFSGGGIRADRDVIVDIHNTAIMSNSGRFGGGIFVFDVDLLTLTHSTLSHNSVRARGGGLTLSSGQMATIEQTTFFSNTARNGGAISSSAGMVTIRDSRLEENSSDADGGGILLEDGAVADIHGTEVVSNTADSAGGIFADINSTLTMTNSTVSYNSANDGGGLLVRGVATIVQSTFANNSAASSGGIRLNKALDGSGGLTLINSTVSGNSAGFRGSGIGADKNITIRNSTIVSNTGTGNGLHMVGSATVTMQNSILAGNENFDCFNNVLAHPISFSLVGDGRCLPAQNGNLTGDPLLGPLADNGGHTPTHALFADSRAVDSAENAQCPATDQRGELRNDGLCDMGAFEEPCSTTVVATENGDSGSGTLRRALANVCDGGTVTFAEAMTVTLASQINVNKAVTVDAAGVDVVVSGNDVTRIFEVQSTGALTLSHMTLANGFAQRGGAILNSGQLTVDSSTFTGNKAFVDLGGARGGELFDGGGAIFNRAAGSLTIHDSTFFDNRAASQGGAILVGSGKAEINNTDIISNSASDGGGLYAFTAVVTVTSSLFETNHARHDGGGLYNQTSIVTVNGTQFYSNMADVDGGGLSNSARTTVTNGDFQGNRAEQKGGGLFSGDFPTTVLTVTNSTVMSNTSTFGGGITVGFRSTFTLTHSQVNHNSSFFPGGGLFNEGRATIEQTTFVANHTNGSGGAVSNFNGTLIVRDSHMEANNANLRGGALDLRGGNSAEIRNTDIISNAANEGGGINTSIPVTITHSEISSNTAAQFGGGIYSSANLSVNGGAITNNTAEKDGGGIYSQRQTVDIDSTVIADNKAITGDGGGIAGDTTISTQLIQIRNSQIVNNSAGRFGGGINDQQADTALINSLILSNTATADGGGFHHQGIRATIDNSIFAGNSATNGGGLLLLGGQPSAITISNSEFVSNTATANGGGILIGRFADTTIHLTTVSDNQAMSSGGGIHANATLTMTESQIFSNTATINGGGVFIDFRADATIHNTSLFANAVAGEGGGIFSQGGVFTIANSTLSGNSAEIRGGGIRADASGSERALFRTVSVINSTLSDNSADEGAGIFIDFATLSVSNAIIANSTQADGSAGADCTLGRDGSAADLGHNLIESTAEACGLTDGSNGNIIGQNPLLDALADNGGSTQTHALLPSSPAIGAGSQTICDASPINGLDQRGFVRDAACDIGAFEADGVPTAVALSGFEVADAAVAVEIWTVLVGLVLTTCVVMMQRWRLFLFRRVIGVGVPVVVALVGVRGVVSAETTVCFATFDNGLTVESSNDASALQTTINNAPAGSIIKIAGTCAGVQSVTLANGTINQVAFIDKPLTLVGGYSPDDWNAQPDATLNPTTLDANNLGRVIALFKPDDTNYAVTIKLLTIQNGDAEVGERIRPFFDDGGGITIDERLTLSLFDSRIVDNNADDGGGIDNQGTLLMVNSILSNNTASGDGGGLITDDLATIRNSTLAGNSAIDGGAIYNSFELVIENSSILNNAAHDGGGIYTDHDATIRNSTLAGNSADEGGGAIRNDDVASVHNSTLSGNTANEGIGAAIESHGTLIMTFSTISDNTVRGSDDGVQYGVVHTSGVFTPFNSIIANSDTDLGGGDCTTDDPLVISSNNLIEDAGAACGLTHGDSGNMIGQDPALAALTDNGGPATASGEATATHALIPGSLAIGAANQQLCDGDPINGRDQRGFGRDAACDIGAFELNGVPTAVALTHTTTIPAVSTTIWLALLLIAFTTRCATKNRNAS